MKRIFVIVTPICPVYSGRKVGSKECIGCDHFRGGIVTNFVDCDAGTSGRPSRKKSTRKSTKKK